jgi:hypothetical protein
LLPGPIVIYAFGLLRPKDDDEKNMMVRHAKRNTKGTKALLIGAAVIAALAARTNVRADDLAAAAAKASELVNRPIAASPHALEEFPWLLRDASPPIIVERPAQTTETYPGNLAAAAAKASALVNRTIVPSPHGLEEFSSLRQGHPPQIAVRHPAQEFKTYPGDFAAAAAKASTVVKRSVVASPHGLEEFPWLLRGVSPQIEPSQIVKADRIQNKNPAAGAYKASRSSRPITPSTHRGY